MQTVAHGTVESVRPVRVPEDKPIEGIFAGAAIGGLIAESIGGGVGAALLGTVAGGFAGNAIQRKPGGIAVVPPLMPD